jgi:hypothetical protein
MSKIKLYTKDNTIEDEDKVIGTDATGENTKNYEMSAIRSYVGSTSVVTKKVTITSEQLLSLDGGGTIELIEAPGAGKVIVPISFACFLDFNTIAYDLSSDINIKSGTTGGGFGAVDADELNSSSDVYFTVTLSPYPGATLEVNGALNIVATTQTITQGDSPLTLSITYKIVDFS